MGSIFYSLKIHYLLGAFAASPNHTKYLNPNIEDMTILFLSYFFMYLLLTISVARFNLTLVFFKPATYAKPGTEKNYGINFIYFKTHILKFLKDIS